jgi:hypothetical protein
MPTPEEILDREFLEIRSRILELAAGLDRVERCGSASELNRWNQIMEAIRQLESSQPNRAEQIQLLFSRPFESNWRERMDL